jgi:DegV family protein with EDD domain
MKKPIIIMTDSNSGILQSEAKDLGIFVVPMPFTINDEEYFEDITITQDKFYEFLAQDADVSTSQPSQIYLEETWTNLLKEYEEIVYIPMSSGLSATCENAKNYAKAFDGKVFVVDNKRISATMKASVFEAIALAKQGKTGTQIKAYLERTWNLFSVYIMVGTLKYLKKGGRISPAAAAIGSALKLKPILETTGDKFEKVGMVLSVAQAKKKMIAKVKADIEGKLKAPYEEGTLTATVVHTENLAEAEKFEAELKAEFPKLKFPQIEILSLSVSCHIGPGSLAVTLQNNAFQD